MKQEDLPILAQKLLQKGLDKSTVLALFQVLMGEDKPSDIQDTREYVSCLVEIQAQITQTILQAETPVLENLLSGVPVQGYALSKVTRREYVDEAKVVKILEIEGFKRNDFYQEKPIGIPALEKLLKDKPEALSELLEKAIEMKVFPSKLKRK